MIDPRDATPEELFLRALELDEAERRQLFDELARARPAVAEELASLLECESRTGDFLAQPGGFALEGEPGAGGVPERIGRYRVLGLLGEGGMGVVYLAEQERPRRTVALKVLRPALASPHQRARFEREAELLGRLAHRGIARIYEAGVADSGAGPQPFFAMEHVRGRALDAWLDARGASARERVELFVEVCDAVEHAHRQGVVHRDLKPGNVLVDESGPEPEVKVLDFGVARALDGEGQLELGRTVPGQLVGTLPYMSPEQAGGDPAAIDARSDVYSLGVLLYELLAGRRPYELDELSLLDAVRVVREREPEPLASFARTLRGDVETIVGKALEKEPRRRYASAGELGADLRRWLAGRAVLARPPSRTDQAFRLARRHKAFFGGLAATLLALGLGLGAALRQNALLRVQRDRAAEEERNARAVAGWFEGLLASPSPWTGARDVTLRAVLERGSAELSEEVRASPAIEARVRAALGMTFASLGELERAEQELSLARERALAAHGPEDETSLEVLARQGHLALQRGRVEEAERLLIEAREGLALRPGEPGTKALIAVNGLARVRMAQGRFEGAEALLRANLDAYETLDVGREPVLTAMNDLATLLVTAGRFGDAIELLEPAVEEGRALEGARHPNTLMKVNNLANALAGAGRLEEALPLLEELYAAATDVLGPDHPDALSCRLNLATTLTQLGRPREALPHLREVLAARERLFGPTHAATLTARNNLGQACAKDGRLEEAEQLYLEVLVGFESSPGGGGRNALATMQNLALVRMELGQPELACEDLAYVLDELVSELGPDHWQVAWARATFADALRAAGRTEEAESELERALPVLERELGPDHPRVRAAAAQGRR